MHYRPKRNNTISRFGLIVGICLGAVLLAHVFHISVATEIVFRPIRSGANMTGQAMTSLIRTIHYGDNKVNMELLESYAQRVDELMLSQHVLLSENNILRQQLALQNLRTNERVAVPVLSHPPLTLFDTLIVDTGVRETLIEEGQKVFVGDDILAGTIRSVAGKTAQVELLSRSERKTEAIVERTSTAIVIEGIGGGAFEFTAPESFDIGVGDIVVTPGDTRFVIARVVSREINDDSSFVKVLLEQPFNIRTIQWVHIDTSA